jgi:hypothetical protein
VAPHRVTPRTFGQTRGRRATNENDGIAVSIAVPDDSNRIARDIGGELNLRAAVRHHAYKSARGERVPPTDKAGGGGAGRNVEYR